MKTILRNFLQVMRRFKLAMLLNVLGLSIAFVAFMVIMMQWDYDRSFDHCHPEADYIFRIELSGGGSSQAIINRPLADAFAQSSPHIQAMALVNLWYGNLFFSVETEGIKRNYEEKMAKAYPSLVDVFQFEMIEGEANALESPEKALMPESMARKIFGSASAVGHVLMTRNGSYTVGGVYKDFSENSSLQNQLFVSLGDENLHEFGNWNYICYVRLDRPDVGEEVFENFKKNFDVSTLTPDFSWGDGGSILRFTPLKDLHFVTNVLYDSVPKSSRQTLLVLFTIAIVIVVIAGINFTNFSTALTPMRVKSINTQKVLGSEESTIRIALVLEAVGISLFSFLLALGILSFLPESPLAALVDADMSITAHPLLIGITALLALFTGLLAGLYPAYYMTSFPPALVLKGSFGLSPKGRKLRNVLISIQYVASFSLIISALFMYLQNYYMQNTPLGYDKDEVIVTNLTRNVMKSKEALTNQLKSFSGIGEVTFAESILSSADQYMGWGRTYHDKEINYQCIPVDYSFLKVMGIQVTEGRDFREEDKNSPDGVYIFNQKAKEKYDILLNDRLDGAEIVGFMPDVRFASFRTEVTPMAFYIWGRDENFGRPEYAYIKVNKGTDLRAAIGHVRTTLRTFDAEYPFNVRFFDEVLNGLYEKELHLTSLITLFSLVAVFISIVGVFGLVVFDSEYRQKEIGIRKVLGSTTEQIIIMFNKTYFRILAICFVFAAPMAWYGVHRWLENFAYKTPMYLWVYIVAFLAVAIITVATVTFQNWRAANRNPVHSIKNE